MIIVFDLMETLLTDPYLEAHEKATGISFAEFERLRPAGLYHAVERGEVPESAYWEGLREAGIACDPAVFHDVRRSGYRWLDGMRELAAECAATRRTVIGSNYPDWIEEVGREFLHDLDIEIFASYQFGVRKPSDAFFQHICERVGAAPHELVLIDDKAENTAAVTRLGGIGITYVSADETRRRLRSAGVLPDGLQEEHS
ncbi:HAD-IA family hydrolase [Streptomyces violaceoruber]|uniref:HAD-IA family hydrolase n=1 Tax=Streptomyces violaceoruber TaxID=1935 RepID=UPI001F4392F8|nr:HAD-IA family hydrolase [Streptomyces violaceoruber]MCF3165799.1 HAD-IA family hydrolase [Streptomyces violaceoruber]